MKIIVVILYFLIIIPYNCISQSYYKLEIQLLDENGQSKKDTILCIYRNDRALWGFEVVTDKGLYFCPIDISLCDSSYISFVSYTNPNTCDRLYLQDINMANNDFKLGNYTIKILSYKAISERRYQKMMKRQLKRFFLTGWYHKNTSKAIDIQ